MKTKTNDDIITFNATEVFEATWEACQSGKYKLIEQNGSSRSSKTWSDFQVIFIRKSNVNGHDIKRYPKELQGNR